MTDQQRLQALFNGRHPCVAIVTTEEDDAMQLIVNSSVELNIDVDTWSHSKGCRDGALKGDLPTPHTNHPAAALFHFFQLPARRRLFVTQDLIPHMDDKRVMRQWRDLVCKCAQDGSTLVMIDHTDTRPEVVEAHTTRFDLSYPDEEEIEQLVKSTLRERNEESRLKVQMSRKDLQIVLRNLKGLSRRQIRQIICDAVAEDRVFDVADANHVLASKRRAAQKAGLLEFVESPVDLADIGGLTRLKTWLGHRQNSFTEEAEKFGLTAPRGVLMLGVQGAGKSLAAKAVATAWRMPLVRMDVGALYDKFIGESERRLRETLRQAQAMAPTVLWIDEIEKAFASAASRSVDGGLSQRMFGTLLTWMQERPAGIFLVATANDIEALPPELLRKGRFDEIFFVDLPTLDARAQIFTIHIKKRNREPQMFDVAALAQQSAGFSGAEIEQSVISALHEAFACKSDLATSHITDALKSSPPISITMRERIAALREWAKGRCVEAD